jgi:membrane protein
VSRPEIVQSEPQPSATPPGVSRLRALGREAARVVAATIRETLDDDLAGEAAKIAYFFFLSLFPLVLIVFALTGIVGGDEAFARIAAAAETLVPGSAWQFVRELIREITERERPGVLSLGILLTLWAASNGIDGLIRTLNTIYDLREGRGWWRRRALAVVVLIAGTVLLVVGAAALVPGVDRLLGPVWTVVRWPLAIVVVTATVWLGYYVLPARDQRGALRETAIGAVVATVGGIVATVLFGLYVANFGRYGRTYGAIGAIIVLLIWFYITGFAVLFGAEVAAVLEQQGRERRGRRRLVEAGARGGPEGGTALRE